MKKSIIFGVLLFSIVITLFAVYQINPVRCNNCGRCYNQCDDDAIYYDTNINKYQIDPALCTDCGDCADVCNRNAISQVPVANELGEVTPVTLDVSVFPNPTATKAVFKVISEEKSTLGKLVIYNIKGQKIKTLKFNERTNAVGWDLTDKSGNRVPSGNYLYKYSTDDKEISKLLTVLK
jgi:MinD superfamily P-loop ATPase